MLQHYAGCKGVRYLTPLGGVGVAIFLVLSGFGLNESFKNNNIKNDPNGNITEKVTIKY